MLKAIDNWAWLENTGDVDCAQPRNADIQKGPRRKKNHADNCNTATENNDALTYHMH